MTKDEMRMIRRESINIYIHKGWKTFSLLSLQVRLYERFHYGMELKRYA
jgi:hypothetical protein